MQWLGSCAVVLTVLPSIATGQVTVNLLRTIDHPVPVNSGHFGGAVNSYNGNILVGATGTSHTVHLMDISTGAELLRLTSPSAQEASFGDAVVQVGQQIAVGDGQGLGGAGQAYLFDGLTGQLVRTINNPGGGSYFASCIQPVGQRLLINSHSSNIGISGLVHAFNPNTGQFLSTITNPDAGGYGFGFDLEEHQGDVFISEIGGLSSGVTAGAVFRFNGTTLAQQFKISAPTPEDTGFFGWAMDSNDSQLLVGAPNLDVSGDINVGQAYLYDANTGNLLRTFNHPEPSEFSSFGMGVALIKNFAVISAPNLGHIGAAYVFDVSTGAYVAKILNPEGSGEFGGGGPAQNTGLVAIGELLVASNYFSDVANQSSAGSVYVYSIVPEPSGFEYAAMTMGTLLFAGWVRRRRASHAPI